MCACPTRHFHSCPAAIARAGPGPALRQHFLPDRSALKFAYARFLGIVLVDHQRQFDDAIDDVSFTVRASCGRRHVLDGSGLVQINGANLATGSTWQPDLLGNRIYLATGPSVP
jgi:hypothetical protein